MGASGGHPPVSGWPPERGGPERGRGGGEVGGGLLGGVGGDEGYYLLGEEGHEVGFPPSLEDYRALLARALRSLSSRPLLPGVVFDRTPLDYLAYLAAA